MSTQLYKQWNKLCKKQSNASQVTIFYMHNLYARNEAKEMKNMTKTAIVAQKSKAKQTTLDFFR